MDDEASSTHSPPAGPLLLIIDDDRSFVVAAALLLEDHGYRTVTEHRGSEGLRRLANGGIDLAIIDVHLPDIEGIDLVRRAGRMSEGLGRIIMISGDHRAEIRQRCAEAGADRFLPKPLVPDELLGAIRGLLADNSPGARPGPELDRSDPRHGDNGASG